MVGSQALVVSVDVRDDLVWSRSGKQLWFAKPAVWAKTCEAMGAGEILLQSIERDGTLQGYDLDLIRAVSRAVSIPVIASGGCSGYEDMRQAIEAGASAVAAGALFQFTDATPRAAAIYLHEHGIEARV